jgi:HSP20 family protein
MNLLPYHSRWLRGEELPATFPQNRLSEGWPFGSIYSSELDGATWVPPIDFVEEKDRYVILMDAPGLNRSDIQVDYEDGILYLKGQREHEKDVTDGESIRIRLERRCGEFIRHVHLDRAIMPEKIRAEYKKGILTVTVPKDAESDTKRLHVKVN